MKQNDFCRKRSFATILNFMRQKNFVANSHISSSEGPMVPTMPPFSYWGGRSSPVGKKDKLDRHFMGTSRQSMLFNGNFVTFLKLHYMLYGRLG